MTESLKKRVYRTFVEEVINKGKLELIPDLFSPDYVDHNAPPGAPTNGSVFERIGQVPKMFRGAFPDVHFTINDMVEDGDWVATRVTGVAQHLGRPFMGIPPTGRQVTWSSLGFFRLQNGKIIEHYGQPDLGSLREQLMAKPEPGSLDANRALVTRYVYEVNMQNYDAFDEFVVEDYLDHDPIPGQQPGREPLKQAYRAFSNAFPDIWFTFEDLIAEGDMVVGRGVIEGTHKGEFLGIPPTNKKIHWTGTRMFRVRNGKVAEGWINFDMLGMLQQLGVIPSPEPNSQAAVLTPEEKRAIINRLYAETNKGNLDVLYELLADDFISHGGGGLPDTHGPQGLIDLARSFMGALPDLQFDVQQVVVEGDFVSTRGIQRATHKGNFMGMAPATGNKVEWSGTATFRFNGKGKIAERWVDMDSLTLFQQLGIIPAFGSAGG